MGSSSWVFSVSLYRCGACRPPITTVADCLTPRTQWFRHSSHLRVLQVLRVRQRRPSSRSASIHVHSPETILHPIRRKEAQNFSPSGSTRPRAYRRNVEPGKPSDPLRLFAANQTRTRLPRAKVAKDATARDSSLLRALRVLRVRQSPVVSHSRGSYRSYNP